MTQPENTPNTATMTRPAQSSQKVARKAPLAWLPWALLAALVALVALILLLVNAVDDDGAEGPADDRLGQVSSDSGDSAVGSDGAGAGGGGGEPAAPKVDLEAISAKALVGGGAVAVTPPGKLAGADQLAGRSGTAGTVLFAEGSAQIDSAGQEVINAAAASLKDAGVRSLDVTGHTDRLAGDPLNDPLSKNRAENVAAALRELLPGVEVTTSAKGQDEPVASNDNEEGRQLNRRAVITARG